MMVLMRTKSIPLPMQKDSCNTRNLQVPQEIASRQILRRHVEPSLSLLQVQSHRFSCATTFSMILQLVSYREQQNEGSNQMRRETQISNQGIWDLGLSSSAQNPDRPQIPDLGLQTVRFALSPLTSGENTLHRSAHTNCMYRGGTSATVCRTHCTIITLQRPHQKNR